MLYLCVYYDLYGNMSIKIVQSIKDWFLKLNRAGICCFPIFNFSTFCCMEAGQLILLAAIMFAVNLLLSLP